MTAGRVDRWLAELGSVSGEGPDAARVDLLAALERLKSGAAAAQARLTAAMAEEQTQGIQDREVRAQRLRSVAGQVGLARRLPPARAQTLVGLARMLSTDLPGTLAALADGELSEWQAVLIGREVVVLSSQDRRQVDRDLAPMLGPLGDRGVAQAARRLVDRVDPDAVARRVRRAEADRQVSIRPAPGPAGCAMARLTATLPVAHAVAAYAGLRGQAERLRSEGDARGIGQLMADLLAARLTGAPEAAHPVVSVEIGLVMSERTLVRGGDDEAVVTDRTGRAMAQVPAFLARRLVADADRAWVTRLYAAPASGELTAMDARRRTFTGRLRRLVLWRDQTCRTPWCEAPVRHADHIRSFARGGTTAAANAAGLCEACNYRKESPGWAADVTAPGHLLTITTPTGHRYHSKPPRPPGTHPPNLPDHLEQLVRDHDDGATSADAA